MLYEMMMERCAVMVPVTTADGEGGHTTVWNTGAAFDAVLAKNNSSVVTIAEAQGLREQYTVATRKSFVLPFHAVFKRLSDGAVFRTTSVSEPRVTPSGSRLDIAIANAERWELT